MSRRAGSPRRPPGRRPDPAGVHGAAARQSGRRVGATSKHKERGDIASEDLPNLSDVIAEVRRQLVETRVASDSHPVRLDVTEVTVTVEAVVERSATGKVSVGVLVKGEGGATTGTTSTATITLKLSAKDLRGGPLQIVDEIPAIDGDAR